MHKLLKMTVKQLVQNVWNLRFGLAVILCVFTCMLSTISYWDGMVYQSNSVLKYFIMGGFEEFAMNSIDFSSGAIINNFLYSPWFPMLILVICAFPAVSLFADEYYSGMIYFTLPGTSINCYSAVKYAASALSGGFVFLCGFVVYAMLVILRFPGIKEYSPEMYSDYLMMYGNAGILYCTRMVLHMTVVVLLYVSFVMMVSTFLHDRYFLFGLPMLFVFFAERLSMYIGSIHMEIYNEGKGWWMVFVPSYYPRFFQSFGWSVGLPYGFFFLFALVGMLAAYFIFRRRIERKVRRDA